MPVFPNAVSPHGTVPSVKSIHNGLASGSPHAPVERACDAFEDPASAATAAATTRSFLSTTRRPVNQTVRTDSRAGPAATPPAGASGAAVPRRVTRAEAADPDADPRAAGGVRGDRRDVVRDRVVVRVARTRPRPDLEPVVLERVRSHRRGVVGGDDDPRRADLALPGSVNALRVDVDGQGGLHDLPGIDHRDLDLVDGELDARHAARRQARRVVLVAAALERTV